MKIQAIVFFFLALLNSWTNAFTLINSTQRQALRPLCSSVSADQFDDAMIGQIIGKQVWADQEKAIGELESKPVTSQSVLLGTSAFLLSTLVLMAAFPPTEVVSASAETTQTVVQQLAVTQDDATTLLDQSAGFFFY